MEKNWLRRRWYDFRQGHSVYLVFIMSFSNFLLISYRLLIEKIPVLQSIFSELWVFVIVFIFIYIPLAMLIGYWHRITQLKVETTMGMLQNPLLARFFRIILDAQQGRASKEEIEEVRKMLKDIEKRYYED